MDSTEQTCATNASETLIYSLQELGRKPTKEIIQIMRSRRALAEGTLLIPEHVIILNDHESDSIRPLATMFTDDARTFASPHCWEPRSTSAPPGLSSSPRYIDPSTLVNQGSRHPCPPRRHWTAAPQTGPSHISTPREGRSDSRRALTHDLPPHDSWSQRNHLLPPHTRQRS